jgi:TPR repeat protein
MNKSLKIAIFTSMMLFVGCSTPGVYATLEKDKVLLSQGHPEGLNNMGSRYQYGDGVARDYKKAFNLYTKAVNGGLLIAKTNLGYMYDNGLGIKQNKKKAISLYKSAAKGGDPRGMINLGEMYRTGDNIEKSLIKACMWYDKARFATQLSSDMQAKWSARGALDKFCK